MNYAPRPDDIRFILEQVLHAPAQLQALPAFAETDADLMHQVLGEAGNFVGEVTAPLRVQIIKNLLGEAVAPPPAA